MASTAERTEPRISVNKLGEYMVASAARRRGIIRDQKRPRDFIVTRYKDAVAPMVSFLEGGGRDDEVLYNAMAALEAKRVSTDFQAQDRELSIEALELFLDTADQIPLEGLQVLQREQDPYLIVAGVAVSVRPDVIVVRQGSNGDNLVGAIKLCLSKSTPLTIEAGEYVGSMLLRYAQECLPDLGQADHRLCMVVDVFGQNVISAPRAWRKRHNDLEAACQEIATMWPSA